jgi:hypothetical protein
LPAIGVKPLAEIPLLVEKPNSDKRNAQIGSALDVVAREYSKPAGVNRYGLVDAKFGRKVSDRTWAKNPSVTRAPGVIGFQIFTMTAESVVNAAVKHQFRSALFDSGKRNLRK